MTIVHCVSDPCNLLLQRRRMTKTPGTHALPLCSTPQPQLDKIVSPDGYGKDEYVETSSRLVIVTGLGSSCGKLSTCLGMGRDVDLTAQCYWWSGFSCAICLRASYRQPATCTPLTHWHRLLYAQAKFIWTRRTEYPQDTRNTVCQIRYAYLFECTLETVTATMT